MQKLETSPRRKSLIIQKNEPRIILKPPLVCVPEELKHPSIRVSIGSHTFVIASSHSKQSSTYFDVSSGY